MALKARILGNAATDVTDADVLAHSIHPDLAAAFVDVPAGVVNGSTFSGGDWHPPAPRPIPPTPAPETTTVIDVPTFKARFTVQEIIAIRASTRPELKALLAEFLDDVRVTRVSLTFPAITQGVGLMAGLGLIEPERVAQILAPQPL